MELAYCFYLLDFIVNKLTSNVYILQPRIVHTPRVNFLTSL